MNDEHKQLAKEVLAFGLACEQQTRLVTSQFGGQFVDPTESPGLRAAGVGVVTTVLEELTRQGYLAGAAPLFGRGGPVIGYTLSPRGREVASDPRRLNETFMDQLRLPEGVLDTHATRTVNLLAAEVDRLVAAESPLAIILLCGRIIESVVLACALREAILEGRESLGIHAILNRLREKGYRLKEPVVKAIELITAYRNDAAHAQTFSLADARAALDPRFPTMEEARGIILVTRGLLARATFPELPSSR